MRFVRPRSWVLTTGGVAVFAALLTGCARVTAETASPGIVAVDASVLSKTALSVIEDVPYWKVTQSRGAKASGVSVFASADKKFDVGVSQYEQVTLALRDWPVDEFMYILEGRVQITDNKGNKNTYGPGDAFVMPKGFNGEWRQLSPIKKINITYGDPL
jgi:uncharacterized cupin superfamily protein